jgi:hypothetical protein
MGTSRSTDVMYFSVTFFGSDAHIANTHVRFLYIELPTVSVSFRPR